MKVRKGTSLTTKSNPYYIELSNAYSLLAEFSANPSQASQNTNIEIKFKISASIRRHEKKNNQINKYIIENNDNDAVIINAAIKLGDYEHKVMDKHNMTRGRQVTINENQTDTHKTKPTIRQRANVGDAFSTVTHRHTNSITRDVKHVHFINRPTLATYHKQDETTMLTYDPGIDGHYLREKDRKILGPPILRVSAKKVGVSKVGSCNGKYFTTLPLLQLSNRATEVDTFK